MGQVSPNMYSYPQNHITWNTIESDHFLIHFQDKNQEDALVASAIAEEIYEPITSLYNHHPLKKTSIVLRDTEDFSNGAAYFFDNKIEIWLPSIDTPVRGSHPWLQNVVTHEFTHIVQIGASMKRSSSIPSIYLQWLTYEDVRRPDVLYGSPKGIVTLPLSTVGMPTWFVEGTAQYQRENLTYDFWDTHRDMLLRTRILTDTQLGLNQMGTFSSKTSLERELVYNQGFSFVNYLTEQFGEEIISKISHLSAETTSNNFLRAMEKATGKDPDQLYKDWINHQKLLYLDQTQSISETEVESIEPEGFFNFHPLYSPDGSRFAYLSNKGRDYSQTRLIINSTEDQARTSEIEINQPFENSSSHHNFSSETIVDLVSGRFTFSPNGKNVIYGRAKKNNRGETYRDLYMTDLTNNHETRLTNDARIHDIAWHPSENIVASVQQHSGTQNIVFFDVESNEIKKITDFPFGTTIFTPSWAPSGNNLYIAAAIDGNRDIYSINVKDRTIQPVLLHAEYDFRDPMPDQNGEFLYFSSDITGIFNIYRLHTETHQLEKITDVTGGAFMPFAKDNNLVFSEYKWDGYKISKTPINPKHSHIQLESILQDHQFQSITTNTQHSSLIIRDVKTEDSRKEIVYNFTVNDSEKKYNRKIEPYSETITGFNLYPVIRFDNYTKLNGANSRLLRHAHLGKLSENLWRDMKIGTYFSSRDVTESFSIFSGVLIGLGSRPIDSAMDFISPSRISELDRDLFLTAEYRGLPFIKKSWSPTIVVEFYNMVRNVKNGVQVEEFACTSCLPTEKSIDIRYTIWEANLFLRSKLNRWSLLELGAMYSPYKVTTDGFFSDEYREFVPSSTSEYFRGFSYTGAYISNLTIPERHSDIAPRGFKGEIRYRYEPNRLLDTFDIDDGMLSPVFAKENNHSIEIKSRIGFRASGHATAMFTSRFFSYFNNPDDTFYLDYIGGLSGMRSYPYFAMGGQRSFFARSSYLVPLYTSINQTLGSYMLDKIFLHLFFETGNAWGGPLNIDSKIKNGIGAELRFSIDSSYLFPLKLFINGTYGFNQFNVTLPSDFITSDDRNAVSYGRELLFYFGLTFDFDLL